MHKVGTAQQWAGVASDYAEEILKLEAENERLRAQLQVAREQCFTLEPDDPIRAALEEKR